MKVSKTSYYCGLDAAVDVIGGKWKALILWELNERVRRFGELRRGVTGISEKMLIQQLRELEADGLVHREAYHEVPPRVEYSLTEFGVSLNEVLLPLCEWGERHMDHIQAIRRCPQTSEPALDELAPTNPSISESRATAQGAA